VTPEHSNTQVYDAVWHVITRRMGERAASAVELLDGLVHSYGNLHRREQELVAGDKVLNNDRELLPRVARATSLGLSVYLGNRRIAASSVLDAGETMEVGGFADATVVDAVLRRREIFRGSLDIGGRRCLVAARPLYATDKPDEYGPVGMVEAFQDEKAFREMLTNSLREGSGGTGRDQAEVQTDRIEAVMHFIDDVARRLQLLALNGNIIAAQAGDHGRAFRVVCRELSSLAEQSKEAVAEVQQLAQAMNPAKNERMPTFENSMPEPASGPGADDRSSRSDDA